MELEKKADGKPPMTSRDAREYQDAIVVVDRISKAFGEVQAVQDLSFAVWPGEVFGLLGPNGAGKTTTIKMILGLLEPDWDESPSGIWVMGMDPGRDEVAIKNRVGYVSEEPLIYKSLTPKELFDFVASIRELDAEETTTKVREYLESLEAIEYYERLIATLSHGNKQKIQVIAAILHQPDLLIMDEPLAGLDAKSVRVVKEILDIHTERGGAVIFCTHIMEVAEELCDRIAIINKGRLISVGTVDELQRVANKAGASLEDIFLRLTEQDESVKEIVRKLRKSSRKSSSKPTPGEGGPRRE